MQSHSLYDIPIIDPRPDPNQPRKSLDPQAMEELVASISTCGVIQPGQKYVSGVGNTYQSSINKFKSEISAPGHPE
jgi:hypothetical protein